MRGTLRSSIATAAVVTLLTAVLVGPAGAQHVACGQTITTDTTLDADVGPCEGDGIVIGADGITLDLNGHEIFGLPKPEVVHDGEVTVNLRVNGIEVDETVEIHQLITATPTGGVGVRVSGRDGVTITGPGTVRNFDAGVALENSTNVTVSGITATDNVGSGLDDYGDGIAVFASNGNTIVGNTVTENGPFDGIGLFGGSSNNVIEDNDVNDNFVPNLSKPPIGHHALGTDEDDGIRLEPGSNNNTVVNNRVKRNGLDGIAVFTNALDNVIRGNDVQDNGFHTQQHRKGDGLHLFPEFTTRSGTTFPGAERTHIDANTVRGNANDGIHVASKQNLIENNATGANVRFDLFDAHADCDANVWRNNTYDTASPDCTKS